MQANPKLVRDMGRAEFSMQESVREDRLEEYVCKDGSLRKAGWDRITKANGHRPSPIDAAFLRKVEANPGLVRAAGGLRGFAK